MSIDIPQPVTILMDDNPILRMVSAPVKDHDFGDPVKQLTAAMEKTLRVHGGRGLAAVQIGVPLRALLIREGTKSGKFSYFAMINPKLERTLNRYTIEREGCLSVPTMKWGNVERPAKCDVCWFDQDGSEYSATLTGETARIFQHEYDHLNGVLITDKMKRA